jgi:glycosyltransferase involved in cell wall biosynthesis
MRILIVNKYHKLTGGADRYAMDLARLLIARGHDVAFMAMDQPDNWPADYPLYAVSSGLTTKTWNRAKPAARLRAYAQGVYSFEAGRVAREAIAAFRPDVIHVQNIFNQLSPSVIRAACSCNVPVVQTLHDYQPVCANNTLHAKGRICEDCRPRRFHSILKNRCYNDSAAASFLAFSAKVVHTALRLYPHGIARFISPSRFLKEKVESFGIPMPTIEHVNNFLDTRKYAPAFDPGEYVLFFGQLLKHKGVYTLLDAIERGRIGAPVLIAGAGPEAERLRTELARRNLANVSLAGYKAANELFDVIRGARIVVTPSEWFENQPYAVLEAFALGKPVLASDIGGIPELIDDRVGGLFPPGDAAALAERLSALLGDTPRLREMGRAARERAARNHAPSDHANRLEEIYRAVTSKT